MAIKNPQNTSSAEGGSFDKNLSEDISSSHKAANQWTQARNAVNNTVEGDIGELSNEASNKLCTVAPYTVIGVIYLTADEWAVFSTDDVDCEIGIFKEDSCSYNRVVNARCLNFNKDNLIKGVSKSTFDCAYQVYWTDGVNPDRTLNLEDVPWVQDCNTVNDCVICEDTDELDCEKLRLAPIVGDLSFRLENSVSSGELLNGSYYVVGAYLVEGQKVTDYSKPSNILGVFNHSNAAGSIDVFIEDVDDEYDEFELVIVQFANFNTVARKFGVYSTRQKKITIDQIAETLPTVEPGSILINNVIVDRSDAIFRNGDYLIRTGPVDKFDFNYQPLANQISTKWVAIEYDSEYYSNGGWKTGYMRDEVYSFFIRWKFNTGDVSRSYHIPGRYANPSDLTLAPADDVIPTDENPVNWKIYNTASVDPTSVLPSSYYDVGDGGIVIGKGDMAYWESSEIYEDDNPVMWNASSDSIWGSTDPAHDLCGKPIRHHKFPDNATDVGPDMVTNHYNPTDGSKIRVMSIEFDNIKAPLDNDGNVIESIVGYEILRGSREGNKTVFAKGMINNTRRYFTEENNFNPKTKYVYPNYPFNPVKSYDRFLSVSPTQYSAQKNKSDSGVELDNPEVNNFNAYLKGDRPLGVDGSYFPGDTDPGEGEYYRESFTDGSNALLDLFTFHSPETNFRNPFLSSKELKIYGELNGSVTGQFQAPKDHPKHKLISDTSFLVSSIIGMGYALISTEGKRTRQYQGPKIDYGGTYGQFGISNGTTGNAGPISAVSALLNASGVALAEGQDLANVNFLHGSLLSLLGAAIGVNPGPISESLMTTTGIATGALGGSGGQNTYVREESPWGMVPGVIRAIAGIPAFLGFYAEGTDTMLDLIYAFTPFRQYALQYISHCFYNTYRAPQVGNQRFSIENQNYLDNTFQDFGEYKINNLFRARAVALKTHKNVKFTQTDDDTQILFTEKFGRGDAGEISAYDPDNINTEFNEGEGTQAASHYAAIKQRLDNQYGQVANVIQVPVSIDTHEIVDENGNRTLVSKSPVLNNGDTYIGRYTEKNTMFFFYDWMKGQLDGHEFDYRLRKNVTHPRFWMDSEKFDTGEFVASLSTIFSGNNPPSNFDYFQKADPNGADCGCSSKANCEFDIDDLCACLDEQEQRQLYVDFLEECADWHCDEDKLDDSPADTGEYDSCTECQDVNGGSCPSWSGCDKYEEGKGKWTRKIKRAKRRLRKQNKKCEKDKEEIYDDYIEELTGNSNDGFFDNLFSGLQTPRDKFALDLNKPPRLRFNIKDGFFYLFNSGVRDFFVETEINIDYRDWGDNPDERHYDHKRYADLQELFSTDRIKAANVYKYEYSLSIGKLFNNYVSWGKVQDRNYDPEDAETCYIYRPKRLIYSLPQNLENRKDNWRVFLPLNYKDFKSPTTAIKPIGKNGAMILFQNESPVQFAGVDQLQLDSGTKVTVGDGGLFSQPLQNLVNAEDPHEYGSCQNRLSIINTPAGLYYMSQNQGKIFQVSGNGLTEISNANLKWWFTRYLPYKLTDDFPDFELLDNPVVGIGCQAVFDNENQIAFFSKKDYILRRDIRDTVTYVGGRNFRVNNILNIELGDPRYFEDASWTVSYDPKTQGWVSYHDWHPDLTIPSKKTFMTTKDNGLWVHADRCDSYCNFYGVDYPFEIEFSLYTQGKVSTLRNIEYYMEAYTYGANCDDRFHVLDFNFDEAVVYNSEQCSGLLRLNLMPKNNAPEILQFPRINLASIDILYAKEEQKYRFNQFWDITDNRGEFVPDIQRTIFNTEANGYVKNLNPNNLNYNKFAHERKKFRHYKNTILLRRNVSGDKNIIISLAIQMNLNSSR